jgi:hypothetical protein
MKAIDREGNWSFELKQIFCRKVPKHGEPYTISLVVNIIDGEVYIELLSGKESDTFTKEDYKDLKTYLKSLGFHKAHYSRYKGDVKMEVQKIHD